MKITYKSKQISLKVKKVSLFGKVKGLMFSRRENAKILLFEFSNPIKNPIHSLFCPEFLAIWLDNKNRVLEKKQVSPWKLSIIPEQKFNKLIEIPLNYSNQKILKLFDEDAKSL